MVYSTRIIWYVTCYRALASSYWQIVKLDLVFFPRNCLPLESVEGKLLLTSQNSRDIHVLAEFQNQLTQICAVQMVTIYPTICAICVADQLPATMWWGGGNKGRKTRTDWKTWKK